MISVKKISLTDGFKPYGARASVQRASRRPGIVSDDFPGRRRAVWTLVAVCVLVASLVFSIQFVLGNKEQAADTVVASVERTQEVIAGLDAILIGIDEAETGQRGFLLTGNESYLEPYLQSREALWASFSTLQALMAGDAAQHDRLRRLEALLRARQAELAHTITLARSGDRGGALAIVSAGEGKHLMGAIRQAVADIITDKQHNLADQRAERQRVQNRTGYILAGLFAAGAGGLAVSGAVFTWLFSIAAARRQAAVVAERQRTLDLMDLAGIMLCDPDGTIRSWSEGCRELYGWTAAEAIGHSSHALLKTIFPVPPAGIEAALRRDRKWSGELRHRTRDGTEVIVAARMVMRQEANGDFSLMQNVTDITALRHAEAALRDNEARLRLVQAIGGIAHTDQPITTTTGLISAEYARLYDLPPGQRQITRAEWLALLHPEDRARLEAETDRLFAQGGSLDSEFRIGRRDGSVRWIAMRAEVFPGSDGRPGRMVSAQQDITDVVAAREAEASRAAELERRVAERTAALSAAEARFRAIFESQFQFIGLLDRDGTGVEINATALEAAGLTREDVIGRPFWEMGWWPASERDRIRRDVAEAARGAMIRHEIEVTAPGDRRLWIDFSLKPVRDPATGAVMWLIPEGRDITEQRSLSAQLLQAQKVQALGQLAGGIAHDFNNILQAVTGAATLIARRPQDVERVQRLSRMVLDATGRGGSITQRLLAFARRGELRTETLPTTEVLANVCEVLAHTLGTSVMVRRDVPPEIPAVVADRGQLETALVNLGTNARDAMPRGGTVTLTAASGHIGVGEHPVDLKPGHYVRLGVTDTGTGMDAATLAQATEPFFTTKPSGQGTGLGLPMAKAFAEQAGGAMTITSTPGAGTTVTLWLPQAVEDHAPADSDTTQETAAPGTSAHILLVDDDDMVRETVAEQLEDFGFSVLVASGGAEAVALLEAGETVDALVTDLSMPQMDGVMTIQNARAVRPGLLCFLLTGYVGERSALEAGDTFTLIRKPVSAQVLAARIEAELEAARRQADWMSRQTF